MRILTIVCAALALCGLALAQYTVESINVHFAAPVVAGEATLPAGDCNIQIVRSSGSNITLIFRAASGVNGTALVNRIYQADEAPASGVSVILQHSGNTHYLDRIVMQDGTGFQVINRAE